MTEYQDDGLLLKGTVIYSKREDGIELVKTLSPPIWREGDKMPCYVCENIRGELRIRLPHELTWLDLTDAEVESLRFPPLYDPDKYENEE